MVDPILAKKQRVAIAGLRRIQPRVGRLPLRNRTRTLSFRSIRSTPGEQLVSTKLKDGTWLCAAQGKRLWTASTTYWPVCGAVDIRTTGLIERFTFAVDALGWFDATGAYEKDGVPSIDAAHRAFRTVVLLVAFVAHPFCAVLGGLDAAVPECVSEDTSATR
jgi:hypothetical protein